MCDAGEGRVRGTRGMYRLELEGRLDASWTDWFDGVLVETADDRTVLLVGPMDQAQLYGVLRRIHDLHLRLLSVQACISRS
jgi:hypothetical protein